jgi:hypothetical protein
VNDGKAGACCEKRSSCFPGWFKPVTSHRLLPGSQQASRTHGARWRRALNRREPGWPARRSRPGPTRDVAEARLASHAAASDGWSWQIARMVACLPRAFAEMQPMQPHPLGLRHRGMAQLLPKVVLLPPWRDSHHLAALHHAELLLQSGDGNDKGQASGQWPCLSFGRSPATPSSHG